MINLETIQISQHKPPLIMIYGVQGIGKTELAAAIGKSLGQVIFIAAEDGMASIPGTPFWRVNNYSEIVEAITALHQTDHNFKVVVFDTISAAETMINTELLHKHNADSLDMIGGGFNKWRYEVLDLWEDIINGFSSLRDNLGMGIILIGHSIDREIKPPDAEPYRKFTIDLLNEKVASLLFRRTDVVGFCNYKISVMQAKTNKKGEIVQAGRAVGTGQRFIYLSERPAFYAKNRFSLPDELQFDRGDPQNTLIGMFRWLIDPATRSLPTTDSAQEKTETVASEEKPKTKKDK